MDVDETTFETAVIERSRELPVVVDFWADWCGPCHALTPVIEREISARKGKVELAKLDVDANQSLAARYDIRGIPAVKAFRNGEVVAEFVGAQPAPAVAAFLDQLVAPPAAERLIDELRESGEAPAALEALEQRDVAGALEALFGDLEAETDATRRDRLRDLMLALFRDLGQEHPVASQYRRRLAATLF
jgi:thioredoxin